MRGRRQNKKKIVLNASHEILHASVCFTVSSLILNQLKALFWSRAGRLLCGEISILSGAKNLPCFCQAGLRIFQSRSLMKILSGKYINHLWSLAYEARISKQLLMLNLLCDQSIEKLRPKCYYTVHLWSPTFSFAAKYFTVLTTSFSSARIYLRYSRWHERPFWVGASFIDPSFTSTYKITNLSYTTRRSLDGKQRFLNDKP